ncbi:MAG: M23 family metallopeptidase [Clostridia bacterium]
MKVKINNIFENINKNKDKVQENKRRILNHVDKEKLNINEITIKRRKIIKDENNFEKIIKIFKNKLNIKKSYYLLFILMITLAGISIYTNIKTYVSLNDETYTVFSNNESSILENKYQNNNTNNNDTRVIETKKETEKVNIKKENKKLGTIETKKITPLSFTVPIKGEILKRYSINEVIYSNTLESYKTHDGIDISGEIGSSVKAIEKGIVDKVYSDSFLGTTVILDHGQGYKSIYSNLSENTNVKVKQVVKKSAIIGSIGNTAIGEIKDKPHIHFMLMFNNKVIDPANKIKF